VREERLAVVNHTPARTGGVRWMRGDKLTACRYDAINMSDHSKIEWTDASWNAIRGCDKISPGCARCYAETFAERFRDVPGHPYEQGFDLRLVPEKLDDPLKWRKPRRIFVNSMSDLFHERVPEEYIARVIDVMRRADWHIYQTLTKRSERMRDLLSGPFRRVAEMSHTWWGVSVENRAHGLRRIDHLRAAPARLRFLSVEPLLEDLGKVDLTGIHWVITGGESGRRPRRMELDWVRSLRDQCNAAGIPFFFKQRIEKGKKISLPLLDGRPWAELPGSNVDYSHA
jgi:protein gp37